MLTPIALHWLKRLGRIGLSTCLLVLRAALKLQAYLQPKALPFYRRIAKRKPEQDSPTTHAKPAWVTQEILRLKILLPQGTGVRKIAAIFNRSQTLQTGHANTRVSKTYVANVLRAQQQTLRDMRVNMRQHCPGISAINRTWGIDLTGKKDQTGQLHFILGIIDHGSRKLLSLLITCKHSAQLARHLQQASMQHGAPRCIRCDNERCFSSPAFSKALKDSSIRQQRIDLHCPWQNGRIERLFGTLKEQLNAIHIQSAEHLQSLLDEFKHWYNNVRLHQHLGYQTPHEVWQQQQPLSIKRKPLRAVPTWWTGWNGQISGVQWPC